MRNTTETVEFSVVSRARLSTVWMYALMRAIYATGYVCIPVVRLPYANVFSIHIDIIKFYQLSPMAEGTHTHTLIYSHGRQTQTNAVCFFVLYSCGIERYSTLYIRWFGRTRHNRTQTNGRCWKSFHIPVRCAPHNLESDGSCAFVHKPSQNSNMTGNFAMRLIRECYLCIIIVKLNVL